MSLRRRSCAVAATVLASAGIVIGSLFGAGPVSASPTGDSAAGAGSSAAVATRVLPATGATSTHGLPATFATMWFPASGKRVHLGLASTSTGRIVRTILQAGEFSVTGNGFSLSPDGKWLYFTTITRAGLDTERVPTAGGKAEFFARGTSAVVSPDGTEVAVAADGSAKAGDTIDIRSAVSGRLLAAYRFSKLGIVDHYLLNAGDDALAWSGDGTHLVALSDPAAIAVARPRSQSRCPKSTACLVVLDLAAKNPLATATVTPTHGFSVFSGGVANPASVFMGMPPAIKATALDRVTPTTTGVHVRGIGTVSGWTLAVDAAGTGVMYFHGYVRGHSELAVGTIDTTGILQVRQFPDRIGYDAFAW